MSNSVDITNLVHVDMFSGLTTEALRLVATIAHEQHFTKGTHVFRQGDAGDQLYVITNGKVRISRTTPGSGEEALAILGVGSSFGEMAIIEETERSADAIVHEDCTLLAIGKDSFEDLLFLHKDLAYEVLWNMVRMLSKRLRATNDKLSFFSLSNRF